MDYQDWMKRFTALVQTLEARKKAFGVQRLIGEPLDEESLRDTEEEVRSRSGDENFEVPEPLKRFYRVTRGFNLQWFKFSPPRPYDNMTGTFNIATVGELFAPDEEGLRYVGQDPAAPFSPYGQFRIFDNLGPTSHVLARFTEGAAEPALFWRSTEGGVERRSRLCIGFDQYLECALAACCLYTWQILFAEDADLRTPEHQKEIFAKLKAFSTLGLGDRDFLKKMSASIPGAEK